MGWVWEGMKEVIRWDKVGVGGNEVWWGDLGMGEGGSLKKYDGGLEEGKGGKWKMLVGGGKENKEWLGE